MTKPMFELPESIFMRWYHWLVYPFAKKFCGEDCGTGVDVMVRGFWLNGKMYITKLQEKK